MPNPKDKEKPTPAQHVVNTEPSQSMLSKFFSPLTDMPSRMASDFVRDTSRKPEENVWLARGKGFLQGAAQGAGDLASDMTSPANLAAMYIPSVMGMRRAGKAYSAARELAMPRINPRPDPINTIDLVMPQRATAGIDVGPRIGKAIAPDYINVKPEYNNADEAFNAAHRRMQANRDVPNNPSARRLEAGRLRDERKAGITRRKKGRASKGRRSTD